MSKKDQVTFEQAMKMMGISIPDFARLTGQARITCYKKAQRGEIEFIAIGSRKIVPRRFYARFFEEDGVNYE